MDAIEDCPGEWSMPNYLSVKETADKLDISAASVRALIKKGELEGAFQSPSRAWLIPAEAVSAYKAARCEKPRSPTNAYLTCFCLESLRVPVCRPLPNNE